MTHPMAARHGRQDAATERLLARLPDAQPAGKGWSARCPAHDDNRASLSISEGDDGRALVHCHAGCAVEAICTAVGLRVVDLMPTADRLPIPDRPRGNGKPTAPRPNGKPTGKQYDTMPQAVEAAEALVKRSVPQGCEIVGRIEYRYHDGTGQVVGAVVRWDLSGGGKDIRPVAMIDGQWSIGAMPTPRPLYLLPEIVSAPTSQTIYVTEGEKAADAARLIGLTATTSAGGANSPKQTDWGPLAGRSVVILPDNDAPGRKYAETVAGILTRRASPATVRIVDLPGLPEKGDIADWVAARGPTYAGELRAELERLATDTPTTADVWPEIERLDVVGLPTFPTEALPDLIREWVAAESHATQTPADLAGLLALAVCAACLARRATVEARPGWCEPVNLFVAVLLPPGNRKSAVFADALAPLREIEAERIEDARPTVAREQSERRQAEARLRKLEKRAAETGDRESAHEAGELAAELAEQPPPVLPRLLVDDATAEKLGMMLADQGGRIASMSPEGGPFDILAGRYSKGQPNMEVFLKGHAGDDLITDRIGRESVSVKRPALTCAYAVQPQVIEDLAGNTVFRGRGLLARFLYAAPASRIGKREIAPPPVPESVAESYRDAVRRLAEIEGKHTLRLTTDAAALLLEWETEIEAMLADGGDLEAIGDWGGKLTGATLRLAGVMHCIQHGPTGDIQGPTIAAAIEIARYLIPHAEYVLGMMTATEDTTDDDARYLLRWIERHDRREFSRSEAQHHGKRRFPRATDIDGPLAELERRGYIRRMPTAPTGLGRPPSPTYAVHPELSCRKKRSQYSRNSIGEPGIGNSGNYGSAFVGIETPNRKRVTI